MKPVKHSRQLVEDQPSFSMWGPVGQSFPGVVHRMPIFEPQGWAIADDEFVASLKKSIQQHQLLAQGFLVKTLDLMVQDKRRFSELCDRVEHLEAMVQDILNGLNCLHQSWGILAPIQSFTPEPYEVLLPFTAVVKPCDDGYEASFFDANIHSSGDTEEEAISNLKSAILDMFDRLSDLAGQEKLGPEPTRQLQVLRRHVSRA